MGFLYWPNTQVLMRGNILRSAVHQCHKEFAASHGASVDLVARCFMCTEKEHSVPAQTGRFLYQAGFADIGHTEFVLFSGIDPFMGKFPI